MKGDLLLNQSLSKKEQSVMVKVGFIEKLRNAEK